jgi:hypothetical protein
LRLKGIIKIKEKRLKEILVFEMLSLKETTETKGDLKIL